MTFKRLGKIIILCSLLTLTAEPRRANASFTFSIPPVLPPDICAFGTCVQFTQSQLLLQIEQAKAAIQNFKHINNIAGMQGEVQQMSGIAHAVQGVTADIRGKVAAEQVTATEPDTLSRIAAIDAQAQQADGTQQQAQVQNLYSSSIAGEVAKTNTLLSAQISQKQAQDEDAIRTIVQEFGPDAGFAPER